MFALPLVFGGGEPAAAALAVSRFLHGMGAAACRAFAVEQGHQKNAGEGNHADDKANHDAELLPAIRLRRAL